ncbi:hypothetical protein [Photobacterium lutimaris]|uniref:Uncharacterized protein n=1 Tax=Photobacterium lutimaris TaxID=388278 RepID=A0A2T3IZ80_9GAMM|nr:hypothetical protein [Photobacterium lutimaris]PSU33966.1 hypothetical protein C9I99_11420 [Photobacterium lutimaris]TDR76302.1 hypothetical protein DFP78_103298 [Photobacterium lutimaris]
MSIKKPWLGFVIASVLAGCNSGSDSDADPAVSLVYRADNDTIIEQGEVTLTWKAENARACVASGAWEGEKPTSGTQTISVIDKGTHKFELTCRSNSSEAKESIEVGAYAYEDVESLVMDNAAPLSHIVQSLSTPPQSETVIQVDGSAVQSLDYNNGTLSFISPNDSGEDQTLRFQVGSDKTAIYRVDVRSSMAPLVEKVAGYLVDDDGNETPIAIALDLIPSGFDSGYIYPVNSATSLFSFSVVNAVGQLQTVDPKYLHMMLDSGSDVYNVTEYFAIDGGTITLLASKKPDFDALLGDGQQILSISGFNDNDESFDSLVKFYPGTNSLKGEVTLNGQAVALPSTARLVLSSFTHNINMETTVSDSGTYEFPSIPTDSYQLRIVDTGEPPLKGIALFAVDVAGSIVEVELVANNGGIASKAALVSGEQAYSRVTATNQPYIPHPRSAVPHQQTVKPRSVEAEDSSQILIDDQVVAGTQNVTVSRTHSFNVPAEITAFNVVVDVSTNEYPVYTTNPDNIYNDTWAFTWSCGNNNQSMSGKVNNTHSTRGTMIKTSTIEKSGAMECDYTIATANIGDSQVPTYVTIMFVAESSEIAVKTFRHVKGLTRSGNRHVLSVPTATDSYEDVPIAARIEYTPADAVIDKASSKLTVGNQTVVLFDNHDFKQVSPGVLETVFEMPIVDGALVSDANTSISIALTTSSGLSSVPVDLSFANNSSLITPIFETTHVHDTPLSRRYGYRDASKGGDGWGQAAVLTHLNANSVLGETMFNDISGQHGRNIGHKSHKHGTDVDAYYLDENGAFVTAMRGNNYGKYIKAAFDSAASEVSKGELDGPNVVKVRDWVTINRTYAEDLVNTLAVKGVYVGNKKWFQDALLYSKLPGGQSIPSGSHDANGSIPLAPWSKPSTIIPMAGGHEGHLHLIF